MSSGAETRRPLSRVLGSPNTCGGGTIKRAFHPRGLRILWRCRALRQGAWLGERRG